jgi:hypothetical protein
MPGRQGRPGTRHLLRGLGSSAGAPALHLLQERPPQLEENFIAWGGSRRVDRVGGGGGAPESATRRAAGHCTVARARQRGRRIADTGATQVPLEAAPRWGACPCLTDVHHVEDVGRRRVHSEPERALVRRPPELHRLPGAAVGKTRAAVARVHAHLPAGVAAGRGHSRGGGRQPGSCPIRKARDPATGRRHGTTTHAVGWLSPTAPFW